MKRRVCIKRKKERKMKEKNTLFLLSANLVEKIRKTQKKKKINKRKKNTCLPNKCKGRK